MELRFRFIKALTQLGISGVLMSFPIIGKSVRGLMSCDQTSKQTDRHPNTCRDYFYIYILQSTRMGSHPLLIVDVKFYFSQQEWVHSLC